MIRSFKVSLENEVRKIKIYQYQHSGKLINTLLNNHNIYFSCDAAGNISRA